MVGLLLAWFLVVLTAWAPTAAYALTFGAPVNFGVGSAPQSLAVGDFNGHATRTWWSANEFSNSVSVLLGGTGASFGARTNIGVGSNPGGWSGKFNGDSDPDLAVANEGGDSVSVFLGGSGGTFTGPTAFAAGGLAQLDRGRRLRRRLRLRPRLDQQVPQHRLRPLGDRRGALRHRPPPSPPARSLEAIAVGKLDGDSDPDLALANKYSDDLSVLLGGAEGSFTGPTGFHHLYHPHIVIDGDFNGDSDPDLAVANELLAIVSSLLGSPGRELSAGPEPASAGQPPALEGPRGRCGAGQGCAGPGGALTASRLRVTLAELNGDSDPDLAVANQASDNVSAALRRSRRDLLGATNFIAGDGPHRDRCRRLQRRLGIRTSRYRLESRTASRSCSPPRRRPRSTRGRPGSRTTRPRPSPSPRTIRAPRSSAGSSTAAPSATAPRHDAALTDGAHTFEVRATDDAGRTDPTPAAGLSRSTPFRRLCRS